MPASAPVRLIIELDRLAAPVQGLVRRDGHRPESFIGWMALARAIELLSEPPAAETTTAPPGSTPSRSR
jgi:hypothetical protein